MAVPFHRYCLSIARARAASFVSLLLSSHFRYYLLASWTRGWKIKDFVSVWLFTLFTIYYLLSILLS
ncbi:hypothetical protein F5B18DRAFT_228418 [Nemania serpens]|nr:hypothetical protein F5B18DRAFT_228418 [Nemania serpens]